MGTVTLMLFGILVILVLFNVPIAIALAAASLLVVLIEGSVPLSLFIQTSFSSMDSFPLIAIPFFILAGDIMSRGGMARRLVDFIQSIVGSLTGSLGIITIIASFIFAAISGSGAATVASIGAILIPYMLKSGYAPGYAASISASAGALGPIVPPSIVFILYAVMSNTSISDLFISGIIPGILVAIALLIVNYFICKKEGFGSLKVALEEKEKVGFWKALNEAKWALLAPILILGGIYGGIVTPTEAAVVAVVYSLIICIFFYKEINFNDFIGIFLKSAHTSGSVLIFVSAASFFGQILSIERIPQFLADTLASWTTNPLIILLLINIFLLIVGMFMETVAAVLIFVPLLLPIVIPLGIDPIHFGMIVCLNLSLGLITPPLGINLFIGSNIANVPFERTFKYVAPIFGALLIVLLIITYVPSITLFLPNLLGG
ncbi:MULTISPECIES: TRAP transporter large permease [unclassified Peribacillus]|uniref:TRAP transporter large permease n=1 Tax=unclassified Peribacillus TaxID=2675266 RepID=UPI001F4D6D4A|nr:MULTISPECIES: TRAP transporter large permease [unclassified Peribacillus]MCK1986025.1 TRAP transporter large permease [Peribacillus sp. Aquil_B1]MCK2011248.1 TRAP transporter large permease [Peribacillus sp. Aquil_B8]